MIETLFKFIIIGIPVGFFAGAFLTFIVYLLVVQVIDSMRTIEQIVITTFLLSVIIIAVIITGWY